MDHVYISGDSVLDVEVNIRPVSKETESRNVHIPGANILTYGALSLCTEHLVPQCNNYTEF